MTKAEHEKMMAIRERQYRERQEEREKMKSIARSAYELKEKARDCGSHFFDPSSMRFFRSRLADKMHVSKTGRATFFVTSEQFSSRNIETGAPIRHSRKYTVRKFANCEISEVGEFQQYKTSAAAHGAAKRAAESGEFGRRRKRRR